MEGWGDPVVYDAYDMNDDSNEQVNFNIICGNTDTVVNFTGAAGLFEQYLSVTGPANGDGLAAIEAMGL